MKLVSSDLVIKNAGQIMNSDSEGKQPARLGNRSPTPVSDLERSKGPAQEVQVLGDNTFQEYKIMNNLFPNVSEGLGWDEKKMTGYMSGAQWFNPMTVIPHPLLQQKIPQHKHRSFDFWIKVMGMMFDDMGTIVSVNNKTKTSTIRSHRSVIRVIYCMFVNLLLLANIVRMLALYFVQDRMIKFYLGDMSFFWTKRTHFVTVPIMYCYVGALGINLCFQFFQPDVQKRWLVPFGIFSGAITPVSVRIRSIHQLRRLVQMTEATFFNMGLLIVCWTSAAGVLFIGTAIRYTAPHLQWISLSWAILHTLLSFYCIGIIGWSLAYFYVLSYHLRMRFKRLNKVIYALLDENGVIPSSKRSEFMAEVIYEHDKTAYDTLYFNRFWKFWVLVKYCLYCPLGFWLIYTGCFYKSTWILNAIIWIAFSQLSCNLLIMITAGEMVSNQVRDISDLFITVIVSPLIT